MAKNIGEKSRGALKGRKYRTGYAIPKIWHHIGEDRLDMETMTHRR
jgi:hypothetical protein